MVAARGHPYERDPFMAMFDTLPGIACTLVEQPLAARLMNPIGMAGRRRPGPLRHAGYRLLGRERAARLHRIPERRSRPASWSCWTGGSASSPCTTPSPAGPRGRSMPSFSAAAFSIVPASCGAAAAGQRLSPRCRHDLTPSDPAHPVLAGVPERFTLTDELYLSEVFEDVVTPLLRSDHAFTRDNFYSATSPSPAGSIRTRAGAMRTARISSDG